MKRSTRIGAALLTWLATEGLASAQQPVGAAPPPSAVATATAAPIAPAPNPAAQPGTAPPLGYPPAPQGAPAPAAAPPGDAWDAAIAKTAHQEKQFETDEERERREERLERDSILSGGHASGRIGVRADMGIWFNEFSSRYIGFNGNTISGDGDAQGMFVPGFYLVQALGDGFELTGLASFALGAGQFLTFGPGFELAGRGIIADQVHLGLLVHVAGWQTESEQFYGSYCPSSGTCSYDTGSNEEIEPYFHAGATGGLFLDPARQVELGVNFRGGIHTDSEEVSIYATAHVAYVWPAW